MRQRLASTRLGDGAHVAYALVGEGPALVYVPGWLTHLELGWALPPERAWYDALAHGRTLVRFDWPSCGLSDASARAPSLAQELETLTAVVDAVGAERVELLGTSLGAAVAAAWAARHPERVTRMVLYGGWARGRDIASPAVREHLLGLVASHWGLGSAVLADVFAPDADSGTRNAFTRYQRGAASASTARELLAHCYEIAVEAELDQVRTATLVVHRDRDRAAPLQLGRLMAQRIPGARFEVIPGRSHLPYIGDVDALVAVVRRFLGLPQLRRSVGQRLTPRQRQVAALVAQGLTNKQIADRLTITEHSAESHVERIRDRLGFRTRSQIAVWYVGGGDAAPR